MTIWGTGKPRREFMYSDDMADACVSLINLPDNKFQSLSANNRNDGVAPIVNIGVGDDITIANLAKMIANTVEYDGEIVFNSNMPDGTPRKLLDVERLKLLGWSSKIQLKDGLARAYEDFIHSIPG